MTYKHWAIVVGTICIFCITTAVGIGLGLKDNLKKIKELERHTTELEQRVTALEQQSIDNNIVLSNKDEELLLRDKNLLDAVTKVHKRVNAVEKAIKYTLPITYIAEKG
jgi:predicted RND superfamily exporter protein